VTAIPLGHRLRVASSNLPGRRAWHRPAVLSLMERTRRVAVPIRSCSRCGLPCRLRCRTRGALLPHLFTLAASEDEAVRSLWHYPWGHPRRMLSGTVCRWSPDFPLQPPFGDRRSGRPADWPRCDGSCGSCRQGDNAALL